VPIGAGTGERGDYVVIDDPHSVQQAESETERRRAIDFWQGSMATRLNDLATGHKVVVQQRVHEADLAGELLQQGGYELLCLMAEFEPERRCSTSVGWTDPRREPEFRFCRPAHMELPPVEVRLPDGGIASIEAVPIPAQFDTQIQTWDLTFKGSATSDYVVGQTWGAVKADRFLLDQHRERLDLLGTKRAIREMTAKWPKAGGKLIEDKANGPAVIQELRHDISGLIEINPEGGKLAGAHAVSPQIESGNVYLPHPAIGSWVEDFLEEVTAFPNARHDDQVDAMTQALNRLRQIQGIFHVPESQIVVDPFDIPDEWPRAYGIAIEPDGVAAVWGARDPSGTIYQYAEHQLSHGEPSENARAIKQLGDWIPGVLSTASVAGSQTKRNWIVELYKELGLAIHTTCQPGRQRGTGSGRY
jgi:predicted phage terminase large subunit-like protein